MNKRIVRGLAVVGVTALTSLAMSPAFATHDGTGQGEASASTGTGLFEILDTDACTAVDTADTAAGTATGRCGDGLSLNDQIKAFSQTATAPGDGTSSADASVAPIDIFDLGTSLDLTGIISGLSAIDTGTILDDVIGAVDDPVIKGLLLDALGGVLTPVDDAVQSALGTITGALPVSLAIGAVESHCTAAPGTAEGSSTVAGVDLLVDLGGQQIKVPMTLGTGPNANLLVGAPQDLVNGIIDGVEDTLTASLGGALAPLNLILNTVQESVTNAVFDALEDSLLPAVADALEPIIAGTVNKQVPVSPSSTGQIEVTALELTVLGSNQLDLARTSCGPNTAGTPHEPPPPPPNNPDDNPDLPDVPTVIDSGTAGDGGNTARAILIGAGALTLLGGTAGLIGYRRMLLK